MPTFEVISLLVLGGLAWLWFDGFKAREAAIDAVQTACRAESCQLLDDTVAVTRWRPTRGEDGQLALRRVYGFEYSDTGNNRRRGSVVMLGHRVLVINIGLRLVGSEHTWH